MRLGRSVVGWPVRMLLGGVVATANLTGTAIVVALAAWVLPTGNVDDPDRIRSINLLILAGYLIVCVPLGLVWGGLLLRTRRDDAAAQRRLVQIGRAHV